MKTLAPLLLFVGTLAAFATPAAAHIACDGDYQIVEGNEIATPYCSDRTLARVARERGARVTGREVRSNPAIKDDLCRFVGDDPRLTTECAGDNDAD